MFCDPCLVGQQALAHPETPVSWIKAPTSGSEWLFILRSKWRHYIEHGWDGQNTSTEKVLCCILSSHWNFRQYPCLPAFPCLCFRRSMVCSLLGLLPWLCSPWLCISSRSDLCIFLSFYCWPKLQTMAWVGHLCQLWSSVATRLGLLSSFIKRGCKWSAGFKAIMGKQATFFITPSPEDGPHLNGGSWCCPI